MKTRNNLKLLLFHILVPLIASGLIYFLVPEAGHFYESLSKPLPLSPIAVIIIASLLYIAIGYAAYLVDIKHHNGELVMRMYYVQLLVNLFFLPIFLGIQNLVFAAIWICLLFILVIITTCLFYKERRMSGRLFLPYCLWIAFEGYFLIALAIIN